MNIAELRLDPHYGNLKDYILGHTGLSYYSDKDEDFATRLARRMSLRGKTTCSSYFHLLTAPQPGHEEMDHLIGELTIGETYFFRQREHFDLLRHTILPELIARNRASKMLRIWSAGCATGAEPYSISLMLQDEFRLALTGWNVSILATDINVDFLARAQEARYAEWVLRSTPPEIRDRCFLKDGKSWILRPEYRRGVVFQYQNLASESDLCVSGGMFDLIFCRNVLIYFSRAQGMAVLKHFHRCLAPGGWLLVGYAEPNMEMFSGFETVSTTESTAYRKSAPGQAPSAVDTAWEPYQWPAAKPPNIAVAKSPVINAVPARASAAGVPASPTVEDVRALADSGHWEAAAKLGAQLIESDSLNPAGHFTLALIHEHLGDVEKARIAFRRAIYLDRGFALAHYHLGTLLQSTRELESARRALRNTLAILETLPEDESLPYGDSITAGELRALTTMHLTTTRA